MFINIHLSSPTHSATLFTFHAQSDHKRPSHFSISPTYSISCKSALLVLSARHTVFDTIVLSQAGELQLVTSFGRLIPLSVPKSPNDGRDEVARRIASSLSMALDDDDDMGVRAAERSLVELVDPAGTRCTAIFEDGEKLRISVDFRIDCDPSRQCFEALSCVLPVEGLFSLKREVLMGVQRSDQTTMPSGKCSREHYEGCSGFQGRLQPHHLSKLYLAMRNGHKIRLLADLPLRCEPGIPYPQEDPQKPLLPWLRYSTLQSLRRSFWPSTW